MFTSLDSLLRRRGVALCAIADNEPSYETGISMHSGYVAVICVGNVRGRITGIHNWPACGIVARMARHSKPDPDELFEEAIDEALGSLPADLRAEVSNVAIVVEDEPPDGRLLGLYSGMPWSVRGNVFGPAGMLPAKVCVFRGPIIRLAAGDAERLRREVKHVVLRELANYFATE